MSGITPLLDTLLHQVLGRRVDIPVARDLNTPVGPPVAVEGARPVHSDSRLDARTQAQAPLPGQSRAAETAREAIVRGDVQAPRQPLVPTASVVPASTVITLSPAAQEIADLLQRFPAPPAAIRPALPLLPPSVPPVAQPPERIAAQLQQSIEHSGLFYESHVARWSRGELPLEVLRREPQMQGFVGAGSASSASPLAASQQTAPPVPQGEAVQAAAPASRESAPLQGAAVGESGIDARESALLESEPAAARQEPLAALVRQQLELLAVPQLRWEGQVWAGLFMMLVVEAPPEREGAYAGERETADDGEAVPPEWRVRVDLRLSGGGELAADIRLRGDALQLTLQSEAANLRDYFVRARDALQEGLADCGFHRVELRLIGEEVGDER